jgi:hypothetical protein
MFVNSIPLNLVTFYLFCVAHMTMYKIVILHSYIITYINIFFKKERVHFFDPSPLITNLSFKQSRVQMDRASNDHAFANSAAGPTPKSERIILSLRHHQSRVQVNLPSLYAVTSFFLS